MPPLVEQGHNRAVAHGLGHRVTVDEAAELRGRILLALPQWRTRESEEAGIRKSALHAHVEGAVLRAVALVDEHEDVGVVKDGTGFGRPPARLHRRLEFVDDRGNHRVVGLRQQLDELIAGGGFLHGNVALLEGAVDLVVEVYPVGDDDDLGVAHLLRNGLGEHHHGEALTAPLRVPDHPAARLVTVAVYDAAHRLFDGVVLLVARHLLLPVVEDDEIVGELQQTLGAA